MSETLLNSINNLKIIDKSFKIVISELSECKKLPESVKEILNIAINSLDTFNQDNFKQLWVLLLDFMKDSLNSDDITREKGLLECYQCILNLLNHVITSAKDASCLCGEEHLLKALSLFQSFYTKSFKHKFKTEIVKMCLGFWKLLEKSHTYVTIMNQNFIFTFDYLFDTIKVTTKKIDMKALTTSLWEFCKVATSLSPNQILMDIIVLQLERCMKNTMFLETETGKLIVGDVFTTSQHLFLKLHQRIKKNLPRANRLQAKAYGEIYFIAWINSNATMREIIEQQGIFDIISRALTLQRTGLALHTYRSALIFLQSLQTHRKHLIFSKVITKLYAPVLWRQLTSEFSVVRCNATEILARAYPLEKRGEGREESSRFLMKQQDAFLDLLEDPCPQVRIAAIKGVCSCLRYFWNSFEEDKISKCFWSFKLLMEESVFEVRRTVFYGLCQLLDEFKSHIYFQNTSLKASMKNALFDENEKVRRAFIHVLLKIKKIDLELEQINKINFASIVNLNDAANALACEDKQNGLLLTDLIFDNFIGEKVPDRSNALLRFNMFYAINPTALRKLIIYSEKHLDFDEAYQYITALLKTIYMGVKKKEERLKDTDKENSIPAKRRKSSDESGMDTSYSPCNTSSIEDDNKEKKEHSNICCMLDCVNCLMILHRNKFMEESNHHLMKIVQDSCVKCIVKLVRFYKEGDPYFSALSVASLIPVSKLTDVALPSSLLSTLKQLPQDIKYAEEEVDMRKVNCLVYTLCMWKRGHEILQFVHFWFDEAFNAQYPEAKSSEVKRVRFKTNYEECKPMTGILLINSMLSNLQTQKSLLDSDVNKKNMYDLILYLQRVKPAIEYRVSSDNNLNKLLSDEVLIEMLLLKFRLHIIYHSNAKNVDEIINYQISTLDWVTNNLLIHKLHQKNKTTVTFLAKTVDAINYIMMNVFLMAFTNEMLVDNFISFCTSVLQNYLGPWVLLSITAALVRVTKHINYLIYTDKLASHDMSKLTNCVCNVISIFGESSFDEDRFTSVIGAPLKFRCQLTMLLMEIHKISITEFEQVFSILIETIINIIANRMREIDEVDLNEKLTELPFAAYKLASVVLSNMQFKKTFSLKINEIFSSDVYKKEPIMLLSAISYIYTLSFNLNNTKLINLEPVVKLLYKTLMDHDKNTTLLGDICSVNNKKNDTGFSILETSDFNNDLADFKQKGREVLIATAKQLRITLAD